MVRWRRGSRPAIAGSPIPAVLAMLVLFATTGCASASSTPPRHSGPVLITPPVDVLAGTDLRSAEGRRLSLAWTGGGGEVVRVSAGWLVSRVGERGTDVWLVKPTGHRIVLLTDAASFVVAPDGERVAYERDGELVVAALPDRGAPAALSVLARTAAGRLEPFWLFSDLLMLGSPPTGGDAEAVDVWHWTAGPYQPSPVRPFVAGNLAYVAAGPAGEPALIGIDSAGCLARLDLDALAVRARACGAPTLSGRPSVSPDGRWLLARLHRDPAAVSAESPVAVVDLHQVFAGSRSAATWSASPGRLIDTSRCAWPDPTTALCAADGGLVRLRMDRPGRTEYLPLTASTTSTRVALTVVPIPDLRR